MVLHRQTAWEGEPHSRPMSIPCHAFIRTFSQAAQLTALVHEGKLVRTADRNTIDEDLRHGSASLRRTIMVAYSSG